MRRSLLDDPESFSLAPLLALLPVKGDLSKLEAFSSSLYARYEGVVAARKRIKDTTGDSGVGRRLAAEEAMLKRVLETLSIVRRDGG